jgi:hypothetical protein
MLRLTAADKKRRRLEEDERDVALALKWISEDPQKHTLRQAAIKFNVGRKKLTNRLNGHRHPLYAHEDQQRLFRAEEEVIVQWCLGLSDRGFPVTIKNLHDHANQILRRRSIGASSRPVGVHWHVRFLQRHPEVDSRWRRSLDNVRANAADPEAIGQYFELVSQFPSNGLKCS